MKVLFRDNEDLVLKEAQQLSVGRGQILLEADFGDKRTHLIPHPSWTNKALERLLREQANRAVIDLEPISAPCDQGWA